MKIVIHKLSGHVMEVTSLAAIQVHTDYMSVTIRPDREMLDIHVQGPTELCGGIIPFAATVSPRNEEEK